MQSRMGIVRLTTLTLRCPPKAGLEGWQAARLLYLDHASRLASLAPQHEGVFLRNDSLSSHHASIDVEHRLGFGGDIEAFLRIAVGAQLSRLLLHVFELGALIA